MVANHDTNAQNDEKVEQKPDADRIVREEQPEESRETTAERPRPLSATQSQSRNPVSPKVSSEVDDGAGARQQTTHTRTRGRNSLKLDWNPLNATLDDYLKVVKQRVNNRQRRCNSTDYHRRFMSHMRRRPPLNGRSSACRSQSNLARLGRKRDASGSCKFRAPNQGPGSNGRRSSCERNLPMDADRSLKRGKFRSELHEKQQLQSLETRIAHQKQHERQLLDKHNLVKKQQIMQTKKQVGLMQNNNQQIFDRTQRKKQAAKRMAAERKVIATNVVGEVKQIDTMKRDLGELQRLKEALTYEMETEAQLVDDIKSIVHKYKRLVAEQTKEKEKLGHAVRGQQKKILRNLKERSQVLRSDNEKLFSEFKT